MACQGDLFMRFTMSGLLLLAILLCVGCSPAKRIVPVPQTQPGDPLPTITPVLIAPDPLPDYPDIWSCSLELCQLMLQQDCLQSFHSSRQRPPVIILGAFSGLTERQELLPGTISEFLLSTGLVYLAAPKEGTEPPSLPESEEEALLLAKQSGADYYLFCRIEMRDSKPGLALILLDLKQNQQIWTDFRFYKNDIDKELN